MIMRSVRSFFRGAVPLAALAMIGCEPDSRNDAALPPVREARVDRGSVLFVGTSLTAGFGVGESQAFPARLQDRIDSVGLPFRVINAGLSGETSAGALRRIDWLLREPFRVFVLETGANDMLRGLEPDSTRANIEGIIQRVRAERPEARIVLLGMLALPNLGPQFVERYEAIYPELAARHEVQLVPFLLEGVAREADLNQEDGIHPNEQGQRVLAENVWPHLEPVLREEAERMARER
jgi:acyl-CoA thioesterase I